MKRREPSTPRTPAKQYSEGEKIGELTYLRESHKVGKTRYAWFKCRCGNEFVTCLYWAKSLHSRSCGCITGRTGKEYSIGEKILSFTFLNEEPRKDPTRRRVRLRCSCGKEFVTGLGNVTRGRVKTCGCSKGKMNATHGRSQTSEHNIWLSMKARCINPNAEAYDRYGGAGITICDDWKNSFEEFFSDMGARPSKDHSIDRIDNSKGYAKENCRWATKKEQNRNQKKNIFVNFRGRRVLLIELCEELNLSHTLVYKRLHTFKWELERALFEPKRVW